MLGRNKVLLGRRKRREEAKLGTERDHWGFYYVSTRDDNRHVDEVGRWRSDGVGGDDASDAICAAWTDKGGPLLARDNHR